MTGSAPVVRSVAQVIAEVERRLARTWAHTLARQEPVDPDWPHAFALGRPTTEAAAMCARGLRPGERND